MVLDAEDWQPAQNAGLHLAFRPIHAVVGGRVFAYQALLRGPDGEAGEDIPAPIPPEPHARLDRRTAARPAHRAPTA